MTWLNELEDEMESFAAPTSESEKLIVTDKGKEQRWLEKRCGLITSSVLPALMSKGRGKNIAWGEVAKKVLYAVKRERRTGKPRRSISNKNFEWGHEKEPEAIEWIRSQGYDIQCSDDFEDVIFHEPFEGFGDSPDFIGDKIVGEIKCPVDDIKIEMLLDEKCIHDKSEYFEQLIGHFIGMPEAERLMYVVYDAYEQTGQIFWMERKDYELHIEATIARIQQANEVVNAALAGETTIGEINEFLNQE